MAYKICQACTNMMEGIVAAPFKYVEQLIRHMVQILSKCISVNPAVAFDFHVEERIINLLECFTGLVEDSISKAVAGHPLEYLSVLDSLITVALTSTNHKIKQEVDRLVNVTVVTIVSAKLEVPLVVSDMEKKWNPALARERKSKEDSMEATPKGRATSK